MEKPSTSKEVGEDMDDYMNDRESVDSRRYLDEEDVNPLERKFAEDELKLVLAGKAPVDTGSLIDVVTHPADTEFFPTVKKTVCYIVAGVVMNMKGQVLLMQEAKVSCRGKWYLPAGRMEKNEHIIESCMREIFEETGLDCEPISLIGVERAPGMWFRFTLYCLQRGGRLKGKADADEESLQARWFSKHEISEHSVYFPLRYPDILPLIARGREYHNFYQRLDGGLMKQHPPLLPAITPHRSMLIRAVIMQQTVSDRIYILFGRKHRLHLPVATVFSRGGDPQLTLKELIRVVFGDSVDEFRVHGLLSLEHDGKPDYKNDGILLTLLVSVSVKHSVFPAPILNSDRYVWLGVDDSLMKREVLERAGDLVTVPLYRL